MEMKPIKFKSKMKLTEQEIEEINDKPFLRGSLIIHPSMAELYHEHMTVEELKKSSLFISTPIPYETK